MTAYARGTAEGEWGSLVLELRSVNHRFLDISLRLPEAFRDFEAGVREMIRDKVTRGKVECFPKARSVFNFLTMPSGVILPSW